MMEMLLKIAGLMALSGVKFLLAPPVVALSGYTYLQTLLITMTGGTSGVLIFFYLGEWMKRLWIKFSPGKHPPKKKIFTGFNRRIIKVKTTYGLIGLALLTPCLFSIPIGSLLAARYFDRDRRVLPFMIGSVVLWSVILTSFSFLFG